MKIIIINGAANRGKDQFVEFFKKHYKHKCINWSTIDKVKKIAKRNFGWNGKKTEPARKFLSDIKRIWTEYNNGPYNEIVNKIFNHYDKLNKKDQKNIVYFIHCREPQEIDKFVNKFNDSCITVLIKRDDREIPDNESDKNVENFDYDFIIENNGTKDDLEKKALNFIDELKSMPIL